MDEIGQELNRIVLVYLSKLNLRIFKKSPFLYLYVLTVSVALVLKVYY